jgi:RNA polymerase sigma-70 factor (ECF subfamily)
MLAGLPEPEKNTEARPGKITEARPGPARLDELFAAPPLEWIAEEYGPRIYGLARHMLGNSADAEDVTQEVLLQLLQKLPSFRGESTFRTWLHRVVVNAVLAFRRKRAVRREHMSRAPVEELEPEGVEPATRHHWTAGPEDVLISRETNRLIEDAIRNLPETYRDVYILADVEGLANAEIADLLRLTVPAVKTRLFRARSLMRKALAPHFEEALAS